MRELALGAVQGLTARDSANSDWKRGLSVSHYHLGSIYLTQGHLADALKEFRTDLAIAKALAALDSGNAQWQRDLRNSRKAVKRATKALRKRRGRPTAR